MPIDLQRIRAVCFDVDGTLSDTDDVWTEQLASRLRPLARLFPNRDAHAAARRAIMAAETPANLVYTFLDWLGLDEPLMGTMDWIARRGPRRKPRAFRLIAQVDSLLPALSRRYPLAVISANAESNTGAFLDHFGLRPYFRCVASAHTCSHTKPFPDPLFWAAAQMGVEPAACLMVGDTTVDVRAGRAAGAQTVGLLCGFGDEAELRRAGADLILKQTAELSGLLNIPIASSFE
jgi:N-acetyl-D-muramate 6-phosphate phosphatase